MGHTVLFYMKGQDEMKKIIGIITAAVLIVCTVLSFTAYAWETPKFMLAADYNKDKKTVTVQYRLLDFAGTESADFKLKFDSSALEFKELEAADIKDTFVEGGISDDNENVLAITFVDLYYVKPEDCEEDGSATVATVTFEIKDESAKELTFIAYAESCNMDPDSAEVVLDRVALKVPVDGDSIQVSSSEGYDFSDGETNKKIIYVVIGAAAAALVFVIGLVLIVKKYRNADTQEEE